MLPLFPAATCNNIYLFNINYDNLNRDPYQYFCHVSASFTILSLIFHLCQTVHKNIMFSVRRIIHLFMILFLNFNRRFLLVATAYEDVATAHYEDVERITSLQPSASEPTLSHQKLLRNADGCRLVIRSTSS